VYLLVTKAILSSVIGSSFYKWWEDTKMGVWFQDKLAATLYKLDWDMLEKEDKWKKAYPNLAHRIQFLEDNLAYLEDKVDAMDESKS